MNIITLDTVDSTQAEARRRLEAGELNCDTLIWAREQTEGRGTQGRQWQSNKDAGLYMTLVSLAQPQQLFPVIPDYTVIAAKACRDVLRELYDLPVEMKPLNDLYLEGRKLAGILLESTSQGGVLTSILTGVGINFQPVALPEIVGYQAIGLEEVLSVEQIQSVSRQQLAEKLATAIYREYTSVCNLSYLNYF